MSVASSHQPPGAGPDSELARTIARNLCKDSLAWARTIAAGTRAPLGRSGDDSVGRAPLEAEIFVEVLAYSLRLLEMRLSAPNLVECDGLAALVRHECGMLLNQAAWRQRNRYKK